MPVPWHPQLTTESEEVAALYEDGLHRYLSVLPGSGRVLREAFVLDPTSGAVAAALAVTAAGLGWKTLAKTALAAARQAAATAAASPMARSHIRAVDSILTQPPMRGIEAASKHLAAYPADALVLALTLALLHVSGARNRRQRALTLLDAAVATGTDHFSTPSLRSIIAGDLGDVDRARADAEAGLAANPRSGHAAHGMAHVFYETANHDEGRAWLIPWLEGFGAAGAGVHFAWHLALHDLALGDIERVLDRYADEVRPNSNSSLYTDAVDILWRAHLRGAETAGHFAALRVIVPDPRAARGSNLALLQSMTVLAGDGDAEALRSAVHAVVSAKTTAAWRDPMAKFGEALIAITEDDLPTAISRLEAIDGSLLALAGSNAQLDVISDTLVWCYQEAGMKTRADVFLIERRTSGTLARATGQGRRSTTHAASRRRWPVSVGWSARGARRGAAMSGQ